MIRMRYVFWIAAFFWVLLGGGCDNRSKLPAEAKKPIPIRIERFDSALFAIDSSALEAGLNSLSERYPDFFPAYLSAVLGIFPDDPMAEKAIKSFLGSYHSVYRQADTVARNFLPSLIPDLEESLQWFRYLVPSFKPDTPFVLTTFIGPMDAYERFPVGDYGDVRTSNGAGIALQFHLGADAALYEQGMLNGIFYQYQVRRFTPEMVLVNTMKILVDDLFPYTAGGKQLIHEMIEKGKRMYLLKRIMPHTPDSLLLGYTGKQLQGCFDNEGVIWNFFVKNDLLYSIEPAINQQYIKDGPKTPELGEASPGYIGLFTGWRIVEAYMSKQENMQLEKMMLTPPIKILHESGYKPK